MQKDINKVTIGKHGYINFWGLTHPYTSPPNHPPPPPRRQNNTSPTTLFQSSFSSPEAVNGASTKTVPI